MKRFILISLGIAIVMAGMVTGYIMRGKKNAKNNNIVSEIGLKEMVEDECVEEIEFEDLISASMQDIKVSPNAVILIKKFHTQCEHTTKEYVEAPLNIVNKTRDEVGTIYKDWEIENFSEKDITIFQTCDEMCDEHYMVKEKDGVVAIYYLDSDENEKLLEVTGISTEYLSEEDVEILKYGIKINGKEELNAIIEDYE